MKNSLDQMSRAIATDGGAFSAQKGAFFATETRDLFWQRDVFVESIISAKHR
jgi:hypothetical protein